MTAVTKEVAQPTRAAADEFGSASDVENPETAGWPRGVAAGARLSVTTRDGVYVGRVLSITPTMLRMQWGAGMWDVARSDLIAVKALSAGPYSPPPKSPEEGRRQAARIMARWP